MLIFVDRVSGALLEKKMSSSCLFGLTTDYTFSKLETHTHTQTNNFINISDIRRAKDGQA